MSNTIRHGDGRKEMTKNPNPKMYLVLVVKSTGECVEGYRDESSETNVGLIVKYRNDKKFRLETRFYKDDEACFADTGLSFDEQE